MSNPRYQPKDFCLQPELFGKTLRVEWKTPSFTSDKVGHFRAVAARLQSEWAVAVRTVARARHRTLKTYATAAGMSYDRLGKLLRGDVVVQVEDFSAAAALLNVQLTIGPPTKRQETP